jgi:cytochrome c553
MKIWALLLCAALAQLAQLASAAEPRTSGNVYLSPQLQALQNDNDKNPVALWNDRGQSLWQAQCQSCHGNIEKLKSSAASFPRLSADGKTLHNLEPMTTMKSWPSAPPCTKPPRASRST